MSGKSASVFDLPWKSLRRFSISVESFSAPPKSSARISAEMLMPGGGTYAFEKDFFGFWEFARAIQLDCFFIARQPFGRLFASLFVCHHSEDADRDRFSFHLHGTDGPKNESVLH